MGKNERPKPGEIWRIDYTSGRSHYFKILLDDGFTIHTAQVRKDFSPHRRAQHEKLSPGAFNRDAWSLVQRAPSELPTKPEKIR